MSRMLYGGAIFGGTLLAINVIFNRETREDGGMPLKWAKDGVHPNTECYITVMEPLGLEAINKVLKTKKSYISPLPDGEEKK